MTAEGRPYNIRYRTLHADLKPKYLGMLGLETRLFNVRAMHLPGDEIHVTEGELDAVILDKCGLAAVGVCGVQSWKKHHPRMFGGFSKVYVWGDGDEPGQEFTAKVAASLTGAVRVKMATGQDVTDLFLASGREGILAAMENN